MPNTDAEMIAYHWGQTRTMATIAEVLPEGATVDDVTDQLEDQEFWAIVRLGRRMFRYWAERGSQKL